MIIYFILIAGLILTPYISILGFEQRHEMLYFAMFFLLLLTCAGFYTGRFKPVKNKFWVALVPFLMISAWQGPKPIILQFGENISNFWVWRSFFAALVAIGAYSAIAGSVLCKKHIKDILRVAMYCGFIMALYCIAQSLGISQWFKIDTRNPNNVHIAGAAIGGTLGHPTLVSPFIGMLIPIACMFRKWIIAAVMCVAIILTQSQVAIGALVAVGIIALWRKSIIAGLFCLILICIFLFTANTTGIYKIQDSGRGERWNEILQFINKPVVKEKVYTITGLGPGSFRHLFRYKDGESNGFKEAHNEYLEVLADIGVIGAFLFIMGLICFGLKGNFYIAISLTYIGICAAGTFVWHLGPHIFYTVVFMGLLHNKEALYDRSTNM